MDHVHLPDRYVSDPAPFIVPHAGALRDLQARSGEKENGAIDGGRAGTCSN